jgi:hypothetical protein
MGELDSLMRRAVADGMREVISDPEAMETVWASAATAFQKSARERTGGFVLGAMSGLFSKITMFLLLVGVVYALGGWAGVVKLWGVVFHPAS